MPTSPDVLDLYDQVIATQPDVRRKGAKMPYTSVNGHMFSFVTQDGHLALRLPSGNATPSWSDTALVFVSSTERS